LKSKEPKDRSASVRARLLNLARERGEDFQITLRNYLFERFLYRLSRSEVRERFVLKGAMLLRLWADQPYRATVDLDLLSQGNPDPDSVARDIAAICGAGVPDDAVVFDASSISVEPIRAQQEYSGVRAMFDARLGTIRERLQVDIGFGDALWPQAEEMTYPVILGDPCASTCYRICARGISILSSVTPSASCSRRVHARLAGGALYDLGRQPRELRDRRRGK
jgi:nucleotidyltransferase AbiEii toxin of type IV toxin-antitoxin system